MMVLNASAVPASIAVDSYRLTDGSTTIATIPTKNESQNTCKKPATAAIDANTDDR